MTAAKATTDHATIRQWVEKRGGHPAHVWETATSNSPGIIRIDFPGYSGQRSLAKISWDDFFDSFDANELAFLYQDEKESRFNKLVSRENVDLQQDGNGRSRSHRHTRGRTAGTKTPHALRMLERQHREVEALFHDYEEAGSTQEKSELFALIADALAAHSKIEEEIFYPAVYGDKTESELREAVEEHLAVKRVIADLLGMKPADEQFDAKMAVMKELVEHHVEEEEQQLFKLAKGVQHDSFTDLGKRMKDRYDALMREEPRHEVPNQTSAAASLA